MAKPKRKTLPKNFENLVRAGDIDALKAMFDACDVDARGGYTKQTALAYNDCPDSLAMWLVERGAAIHAVDTHGETPLHARAGHWQGRIQLLLDLGADMNHDGGGRGTPLHRAAAVGNVANARLLLDRGSSPDALNDAGQTPLAFALQRCSNATLDRMAPMAELLLPLMSPPIVATGLLRRLFGGGGRPASAVTPQMREQVQRIGTEFEFHRAGFNPDGVDAASEALDRLYTLFDVPPIPRRAIHDGKAPIAASGERWEDRHQELWQLLVPSSGAAATVQGEVIRISGRIAIELDENGGINWDADYKRMVDGFLRHIGSGRPLPSTMLAEARALMAEIKPRRGDPARLCRMAVEWVVLNPRPMALLPPDYAR